jgi:hypothetical protein
VLAFYQKLMSTPYLTQSRSDNIKEQEVFNKESGRDIHVLDQTVFWFSLKIPRLYKKNTLFVILCGW